MICQSSKKLQIAKAKKIAKAKIGFSFDPVLSWSVLISARGVQDPYFRTLVRKESAYLEQTGSDPAYGLIRIY